MFHKGTDLTCHIPKCLQLCGNGSLCYVLLNDSQMCLIVIIEMICLNMKFIVKEGL